MPALVSGQFNATTGKWNITSQAVYFAQETDRPSDENGSTVIYGHNNRKVFGATKNLKIGDLLIITTENQHRFTYAYKNSQRVEPTDISVLSAKPIVAQTTLITCDGLSNEFRRLMHFELVEAI